MRQEGIAEAVRRTWRPEGKVAQMEDLKPEAAYFAELEGARGRYLVVNMDDASQMPAVYEPFFLGLGATVQIQPAFTPDDMPRVTEALERAVQKYG